jgi:hypothetical protein
MFKRVGVVAVLFICSLILAACGLGARADGLPTPPADAPCLLSGSQITGNGPVTTLSLGPACRDVTQHQFQEAGQETTVDLEHSSAGGTADLSYDHFTGDLKPIHGATVSRYKKYNGWWWPLGNQPTTRSDYPGERECRENRASEQHVFSKDDLAAEFSIFCIKTAEGHDGFLIVNPRANQKPDAYDVYAYIWVR